MANAEQGRVSNGNNRMWAILTQVRWAGHILQFLVRAWSASL